MAKNVVRLYKERLNLLLDVAQTINEDNSVDDLMQEFEILLREELGVGKILIFTREGNSWNCILQQGVPDQQRDAIDIDKDLPTGLAIENLAMSENPNLAGFDAVIPLLHKYKLMGYVLVGDDEESADGISPTLRNLKFIQILSNIIIVFIENKKMQARLLEQEGLRKEIALASRIQAGLVPPEGQLLQTGFTRAMSYYHPHQQVGGDYFDVLQLSPTTIGFCIADVSGKGVAAALLMSNFQALVRALFTASIPLDELVSLLNSHVASNTHGEKFVTSFIARYDCISHQLSYVNAAQLPPIVFKRSSADIVGLFKGTIGLGMLDELPSVDVGDIQLDPGDLVVSYTDGLVEYEQPDGSVGNNDARLESIMRQGLGIDLTMKAIASMAEELRLKNMAFDDTSVLAIEVVK